MVETGGQQTEKDRSAQTKGQREKYRLPYGLNIIYCTLTTNLSASVLLTPWEALYKYLYTIQIYIKNTSLGLCRIQYNPFNVVFMYDFASFRVERLRELTYPFTGQLYPLLTMADIAASEPSKQPTTGPDGGTTEKQIPCFFRFFGVIVRIWGILTVAGKSNSWESCLIKDILDSTTSQ